MKNKLIFLFVVFVLLLCLLLLISKNRNNREKERLEEKTRMEHQQFVQDSLRNVQKNSEIVNSVDSRRVNANIAVRNSNATTEDLNSYINSSITNTSSTDVSVTIIDQTGNISQTLSSSVANIYTDNGNNGKAGLIKSSFLRKPAFLELMEGNSEVIQKLKLSKHTDFLVLGRIKYSIQKGTLVDGTYVCTASLTMKIISIGQNSLVNNFSFSANGNGATEEQAKEYAIDKLLSKYKSEYSSI